MGSLIEHPKPNPRRRSNYEKLLILALAVSVMFTVAGFAQDMSQRQWNGQGGTGATEEHQGNGEG